jgi:hypothetical protein
MDHHDEISRLLLADLMAKSLIFTHVLLGTQGSILFAIMLHPSTNLFAVSPPVSASDDLTLAVLALLLKTALAAGLFIHLPRSFRADRSDTSAIGYGSASSR